MKAIDDKPAVPSFDEIVFENRNKEYGAYTLRKKYNKSLLFSMIVGCFFISATVITPYAILKEKPIQRADSSKSREVVITLTDLPPIDIPKEELPKIEPLKEKQLAYVAPKVVDSVSPEEDNKFINIEDAKTSVKNDSVNEYIPEKKIEIDPEIDNGIKESFTVNEKPVFGIDGDNEFRGWIAKNIIYPPEAVDVGLQGRVYLRFVVEKDGSISNIEVVKSEDPILSKEAVRVVGLSPKWTPGKVNGSPVRVRMFFPITFALSKN